MTTSLINNDDVNGIKGAAKDLSMDPESFQHIQGDFDTASISSRLRQERAQHSSIKERQTQIQNEMTQSMGGMMKIGQDPRYSAGLNAHQQEIRAMLMNPDNELYYKADDPVYEEFRKNIRDRESFNKKIQGIKINDRIKIWRTERNIDDDCKAILKRQEDKKKADKKKVEQVLLCGCLRKKKVSAARRQWLRLASRSKQILRKKNDNHYQGFQGEPCEYNLQHKHNNRQEKFEFALFLAIFLIGAYFLMEMFCPGIFGRSYNEIKGVSTGMVGVPGLIATAFYNAGLFALGLPEQIINGISGQ